MSDGSPPPSICFIRAAESYPKSQMEKEDSQLLVPFQELPGESIKYLGRTDDGILALSNYRIFLSKKSTAFETYVPLGLIESVQVRDPFQLIVNCKDASTVRCSFQTTEQCVDWQRRIHLLIGVPQTLETLFAFGFYSWSSDIFGNSNDNPSTNGYKGKDRSAQLTNTAGVQTLLNVEAVPSASSRLQRDISYDNNFKNEVARLGFDLKGSWRVSTANADFKLCPSYPPRLLVPFCITDEMLHNVANFRGSRRLPAVVWRHQKSGAILARCSQPEVGWLGWRNTKDEQLLKALTDACAFDRGEHARRSTFAHASAHQPTDARDLNGQSSSSGKSSPSLEDSSHEELTLDEIRKILIVDARSYTSAVTNRARGGGCECIEYYPCAEIEFMNLGNIHAIRKSFHAVRQLCASSPDDPNWFGQLEKTMWMQHLSGLLGAAMTVVHTIEKNGRPVLVHCSDGWDRTPQIVATAQLCLDPYYRTVEGFRVLVEREWLNFGHKFADRSGNGPYSDEVNERCPVFLQWLDLVHQIQRQYPCCFEFNGGYLIKMAQHSLSCLFGTFLCNSLKERLDNSIFDRTFSVWPFLADTMYRNPLYKHETEKVLWPAHSVRFLHFWSDLYLGSLGNKNGIDLPLLSNERPNAHQGFMVKARSSENLTMNELGQSTISRRSSDPNLAVESIITECLNINSNSMFDLRSEADISVRENFQYDVKNSKDLEVDVTDAKKEGKICLENTFSETQNDQSKASKRDIINVAPPLPAQSSLMCSRNQIHRSGRNVPAFKNSGIDQSPPSNDKQKSDTGPAFWQGQCDVSSDTLSSRMPTKKNQMESKTRNLGLESHQKNIDAASETQSSQINLSFNILPKVHLKPNVGRRLRTDYAFPHHLDLQVPRENAGSIYKRVHHSLSKNENINGSALAANSNNFEESQYTTFERTVGKSSFVCSSGARVRRNTFGSSYSRDIGHLKITAENGSGSGNHVTSYGLVSLPPTPQSNQERIQLTISCPDGLAHGLSEQNIRLYQIVQEHKLREETLLREIHSMRLALLEKGCPSCNSIVSANMEHENGSDIVENASTCSWEAVEERCGPSSLVPTSNQEKKASSVLWVPDHAVSRCSSCQTEFWLGRRRHHCRSCGEIFCADCSEYWAPLPFEKLFNPVRLCGSCYTIVTTDVHGNAAVPLKHSLNEATQCSANT
ncbi:phosphatidylinositol-3,5-bisphosphate 3-phosphatase MTMR4 isoform X1 [Drosophila bipectinata]|uniref:phosphatidylinositol-3,5-bisphosphate 3-phosphatase MTMR4 isoform X1 n=1 Tax=Drosophila bipectinata TaxID=42026 RepID=UPI001C8A18E3|nr:myotubularin-related protein 3 [Drosophila bipectinata]XP_043067280.1 myotubularin-related protein 3 [Drosophila bipectinata]XP_043067281.1 myotubularin-related protein 3 [Drosophila bipectinata]XP_043067282.1 myotubularin-related protein 3 [Drosophila bipectinata]XP_043067283.1 myotubularin-related protein 3 [Drosophila bipectinata]XP_043067284.1 myotubularin-related protein 3 [Drosophila bipectinata]XP_043067285.1 myotubularin-related protein 3 [Drosophila bipectinata]